jgi:glycosyltransferase involved in cell wall biosynthesis
VIPPLISVLIPCYNEELFIEKCLNTLIANDYQADRTEIFVIDGLSTDNTNGLLKKYSSRFKNIKVLTNPKRVFPAAVNLGIRESKGDYIFIMGAHAEYPVNYFSKCIECSVKFNADNVGGILNTIPVGESAIGKLISTVLSNPFGVGNSKFRTGTDVVTEVDTVFGGYYRKEVFEMYGFFAEDLISTSDYEFNSRIKRQGAKIILDPEIIVNYYTRSSLISFIKNNLRNGYWAIFPIAVSKNIPVSLRHFVPLIFTLAIISLVLLSFKWPLFLFVLFGILAVYFISGLYFSINSVEYKYYFLPVLSILFLILHISYGIGSLWGLIRVSLVSIRLLKA